ncbi:MAG: hypothetical protein COC15_04765 [Legionellales bacterium]|nr:MAG: hypothetical protein COC15_04765 [Legionellales bacterium]
MQSEGFILSIRNLSLVRATSLAREIWQRWLEPIGISKFYHVRAYDTEEQVEICSHIEDEIVLYDLGLRKYVSPFSQLYNKESIYCMHRPEVSSFENINISGGTSAKKRQVYADHGYINWASVTQTNNSHVDSFAYCFNSNECTAAEQFTKHRHYLDGFMSYMQNSVYTDVSLSEIYASRDARSLYDGNGVHKNDKYAASTYADICDLLPIDRIYFDSNCSSDQDQKYLTTTEAKCFYNELYNVTAKESSIALRISYRTVQKHLSNIKNKWNMNAWEIIDGKRQYLEFFKREVLL